MNRVEFFREMEAILEAEAGSIKDGSEELLALGGWDSMAFLSVIALADEHFGIPIKVDALSKCVAVADLANLFGEKIEK